MAAAKNGITKSLKFMERNVQVAMSETLQCFASAIRPWTPTSKFADRSASVNLILATPQIKLASSRTVVASRKSFSATSPKGVRRSGSHLNRRRACRPISDIEQLFFERRGDGPLRLRRKFGRCYRHRLLIDTTVGLYRHRRCRTLARFHTALSQIQPGVGPRPSASFQVGEPPPTLKEIEDCCLRFHAKDLFLIARSKNGHRFWSQARVYLLPVL
jgi:hypothetical protein